MSAHYAMCKYDDATGSYIPLEVRPITDKLKKDDPLYQEGFQAGAYSRDAEIERLEKLSVTQVMIDIVPGYEGSGLEIYAKSVADVERLIGDLGEKAEDFVLMTKPLQKQLAAEQAKNVGLLDFIARAQVSSGVCCCGETMDGHSSPMSCGHSPVDMWDHAVRKLLAAPSDTSALEAIVKKVDGLVREKCITAAGPEDSYQDDWIRAKIDACDAICAIPAVTLEDLELTKTS